MYEGWKFKGGLFALLFLTATLLPNAALAISVDVAKKCNELVAKQFPPRQAGNPAAGSSKGNGQAEREYFQKCVANNGKMDDTSAPAPSASPIPNASPAPKAK
jgi:hypothetical protein